MTEEPSLKSLDTILAAVASSSLDRPWGRSGDDLPKVTLYVRGSGPRPSVEASREPKPSGVQSPSNWHLGLWGRGRDKAGEQVRILSRPHGPLGDLRQEYSPTPGNWGRCRRRTSKGPHRVVSSAVCFAAAHLK